MTSLKNAEDIKRKKPQVAAFSFRYVITCLTQNFIPTLAK
jgi:hypothetical protein